MYGLMRFREAFRNAVARVIGTKSTSVVIFSNQRQAMMQSSEVMALAETPVPPMFVRDTADPNFGLTYFIAGYHAVGDPDHPVGP